MSLDEIQDVLEQILAKLPDSKQQSGKSASSVAAPQAANPFGDLFDSLTKNFTKRFDSLHQRVGQFFGSQKSTGAASESAGGEAAAGEEVAGGEVAAGAAGAEGAAALLGPIGLAVAALGMLASSSQDTGKSQGFLKDTFNKFTTALGPAGYVVSKFEETIEWATVGIGKLGESTLESNRHLAQFSGQIAAIFAQSDVQDQLRAQRVGEATAGSTGTLASSLQEFKTAFEPISEFFTNAANTLVTVVVKIGTMIAEFLGPIFRILNEVWSVLTTILYYVSATFVDLREKKVEGTPVRDFIKDMASGKAFPQRQKKNPFDKTK